MCDLEKRLYRSELSFLSLKWITQVSTTSYETPGNDSSYVLDKDGNSTSLFWGVGGTAPNSLCSV